MSKDNMRAYVKPNMQKLQVRMATYDGKQRKR